jgi:hypothetical protein
MLQSSQGPTKGTVGLREQFKVLHSEELHDLLVNSLVVFLV